MELKRVVWLLVLLLAMVLGAASCGGDGGDVTVPTPPDEDEQGPGGDPDEPPTIPIPPDAFLVPGGYGDLRGVAASQEYVYVADSTVLYAFDKVGNFVNAVPAPNTIQALAVFPPKAEVDILNYDAYDYVYAGFPVILHEPTPEGYIRIFGPNLDLFTTREDQSHQDAVKYIALPFGQTDPPVQDSWALVPTVYDMTVDRFGSILVMVDLDAKCTDPAPDFRSGLQILNRFNGYAIEYGGPNLCPDPAYSGPSALPINHPAYDFAAGDQGTVAVDTYFPFNRTELTVSWYTGHYNLLRDYVGVTTISLNPNTLPPSYEIGRAVNNGYGYARVIGETVGNAPGSFNQNPPLNPDGGLEDPDLTNGGPSGMAVDWFTDNVYICDPGNRRIQVFQRDTGAFVRQIGDGTRGRAGNAFLAPSEVALDLEGNIFVCDVTDLRVLQEKLPNRHYGSVGGTVRRLDLGTPLEGATVTLGSELGTLAVRSTNINGDYLIRNLLVGTYYMTAGKFNYDSDTTSVDIINDTTVRIDFNLSPRTPATTGSYTGNVIDDFTNLPLEGVAVQIVGTGLDALTDDLGRFHITNVAPGVYQVVFSLAGYETLTRDMEIVSGAVTTENLVQLVPLPAV